MPPAFIPAVQLWICIWVFVEMKIFKTQSFIMSIAQNDVITLKIGNITAGRDFTTKSLNIQAVMF